MINNFKHKFVSWLIQTPLLNVVQVIRDPRKLLEYLQFKHLPNKPRVVKLDDTLRTVADKHLSVVRFGDGELAWMMNQSSYGFQSASAKLAARLQQIITSPDPGRCAICIPDVFDGLGVYVPQNRDAWMGLLGRNYASWAPYLSAQPYFYDANMTRFYIDRKDKSQAGRRFKLLKKLWAGRSVLIVEGEDTRFGVDNDLLASATRVRRIICPAENAFASYDEILSTVSDKAQRGELILIGLGPTATVLAYDLSRLGHQAIDIGHADLEYEWYLMGVTQRVNLPDRYVNEVRGGQTVKSEVSVQYHAQIISVIKGG